MDVSIWVWAAVIGVVLLALALDLFVFHKDAHEVSIKEAAISSSIWVALGLAVGVVIWIAAGGQPAGEYYAGYVIEKALSVENIFVFALILGYFEVPPKYQHRVLFFGVLGAIVMRAGFIAAGAELLERFHWMVYVFGAFLVFTAVKMLRHDGVSVDPSRNPLVRGLRKVMPMTDGYHGQKFFVRHAGKIAATPMFAVLLAIETSDVIFAVDSIPAIFAITDDTFIVFTSNLFAILGLRALYFLLAGAMARLSYLKLGLAAVLGFVGLKMLASEFVKLPVVISLGVIVAILTVATVASLRRPIPMAIAPTADGIDPTPKADDPTPKGNDPTPKGNDPTSKGNDPTSKGNDPTSMAVDLIDPTPTAIDPTPTASDPAPEAIDPTPRAIISKALAPTAGFAPTPRGSAFNKNNLKTVVLLASLGGALVTFGSLLGGQTGMVIGLLLGLVMVGGSYWFSDKLAVRAAGAVPVGPDELTWLQEDLDVLARRAGIATPRLYRSPSPQPNAFATGRNEKHAVVAVTDGLLSVLDRREVRGVIAHELGHIRNRDILIGSIAAAIATGISAIANMAMWSSFLGGGDDEDRPNPLILLLTMLVAPLAASLLQMALSRSREFEADRVGADIAGDPGALADALTKIETYAHRVPMDITPAQASAWIVNPLSGRKVQFANLFLTHPPTEERVARLRARRHDRSGQDI